MASKVDVYDIAERHLISQMNNAIRELKSIVEGWIVAGAIPEIDWNVMRLLEFQEILRSRNELAAKIVQSVCLSCPEFLDHVSCILS